MRTEISLVMLLLLSLMFNQIALAFAHVDGSQFSSHHGEHPSQCSDLSQAEESCENRTHAENHCCLSSPLHCNQLLYAVSPTSVKIADLTLVSSSLSDSDPFRSRTLDVELRPPKTALPLL